MKFEAPVFLPNQEDNMGKRFQKDGKTGSTSYGGISEKELKALADKTSFSLENVTEFHEV